jgi:predicted RNase H-like HicB family nuclease
VDVMTTKTKKNIEIKFRVKIVIEKDDPGYHAYAPSLKGLHMGGDTPEEALLNAKEAAALYLKSMYNHGDPFPIDVFEREQAGTITDLKDILSSHFEEIGITL